MATRRNVLAGLLATGLAPRASWADAGYPVFLTAGKTPDGQHHLLGLAGSGDILFRLPLAARGHAGAAHPNRPEAVAFARRPGTFAVVIDCVSGRRVAELASPEGRHFYGHGAYSADGSLLFTTENDFEAAVGVIGVWDVAAGYLRIDEFPSGGVGPHEVRLLPGGEALVVANGGIETHPDSGRAKLNIATMQPNLTYVSLSGQFLAQRDLGPDLHRCSIRHLSVRADGLVALAMQWQGEQAMPVPLLAFDRLRGGLELAEIPDARLRALKGYIGSVSFSSDGTQVAVSSPRGGEVQIVDADTRALLHSCRSEDVCGVGTNDAGFVVTTGRGAVVGLREGTLGHRKLHNVMFDNHLVPVA